MFWIQIEELVAEMDNRNPLPKGTLKKHRLKITTKHGELT